MLTPKAQIIRPHPLGGGELAGREKIIAVQSSGDPELGDGDEEDLGGEDGDEASDPGKIETEGFLEELGAGGGRTDLEFAPDVRLAEDGSILPVKAEMLALNMADGFTKTEAWRMVGGERKNEAYGRKIRDHPVFRARLQMLVSEKMRRTEEGIGGDILWAVKQNWRIARATGKAEIIHRATVLLVETGKGILGAEPEGGGSEAPAGAEAPKGPGRPPHQPRSTRPDVSSMRSALMKMGVKAPATVEAA